MTKISGRLLLTGLLCASLTLAGCMATTLLYNHADWLITRQIDGYFDLTRSQKHFVASRLDGILTHHRREALPRYESVVRQARERVQDGLSTDDLDWVFVQYDQLRTDLFSRFAPDGAEFVRQVNEPQVTTLKKALQSRLAREEDLLRDTVQARLSKRTERFLALAREWLGPLSSQQEKEITRVTMSFPDTLPAWYAHQVHRHEQLIALIESRHSSETASRLRDWLVQQDADSDPHFAEVLTQLRRHITMLALTLDRSATPEQRRHFVAKLDDLTNTIQRLRAT